MKRILEAILYLSIAGIGVAGIIPDKLGIKPYKKYEIYSLYQIKQDSLYIDYLTKIDSLEKGYFSALK